MKPRITVIGSTNTDMILKIPHLPRPGETVLGGDFRCVQGGKGANQAIAATRAGADVVFISCIGDDDFGRNSLISLEKEMIDTRWIKRIGKMPSGIALINVAGDGENSISVAPGANRHLLPEDILKIEPVIRDSDLLLVQLEIPVETVAVSVKLAKKHNVKVILNPAPAMKLGKNILKYVDIITPNEREAAMLVNRNLEDTDLQQLSSELKRTGVDVIIITLGSKGAYYHFNGEWKFVDTYRVDVVDVTAAGDTFNGYLAVSLAKGENLGNAIRLANKAASIAVTRLGAQTSIPWNEEVINSSN